MTCTIVVQDDESAAAPIQCFPMEAELLIRRHAENANFHQLAAANISSGPSPSPECYKDLFDSNILGTI